MWGVEELTDYPPFGYLNSDFLLRRRSDTLLSTFQGTQYANDAERVEPELFSSVGMV
mgnify:CR=1 FL=1